MNKFINIWFLIFNLNEKWKHWYWKISFLTIIIFLFLWLIFANINMLFLALAFVSLTLTLYFEINKNFKKERDNLKKIDEIWNEIEERTKKICDYWDKQKNDAIKKINEDLSRGKKITKKQFWNRYYFHLNEFNFNNENNFFVYKKLFNDLDYKFRSLLNLYNINSKNHLNLSIFRELYFKKIKNNIVIERKNFFDWKEGNIATSNGYKVGDFSDENILKENEKYLFSKRSLNLMILNFNDLNKINLTKINDFYFKSNIKDSFDFFSLIQPLHFSFYETYIDNYEFYNTISSFCENFKLGLIKKMALDSFPNHWEKSIYHSMEHANKNFD